MQVETVADKRQPPREKRGQSRDADLVRRFLDGDAAAFDEIVLRHRGIVYAVARRLLRSHDDADEATQAAFVRAWRGLRRFRGDAALRTWLVRIVINVARTMRSATVREDGHEAIEDRRDPGESSESALGRRQERLMVRRAVAGLPPRQREVVVLKVFSEMTYAEVATVMDLSEGAVKAHLHQAVANLRRLCGATKPGEG